MYTTTRFKYYLDKSDNELYILTNIAFLTDPNYRKEGKKCRMDIILTKIFEYDDFDSILILCGI